VTNFGALVILALPGIPERQLRLLLALETVTRDADGWRQAETGVLAQLARMSVNTAAKARGEAVKAGLIEYRPGTGPGHPGRYRILLDVDKPPKNAGAVNPPKNAGGVNPPNDAGPVNPPNDAGPVNPPKPAPVSHPNEPQKPTTPNAVTSADASISLEPLTLESSSLREAPRLDGHAEGARSGQGDDDDFADYETRPRRSPGLGQCTACGWWFVVAAGGRINRHETGRPDGSYGTCPGAGQPPARPVRCTGCGRTGLALASLTGLCTACTRERKEAEADGGTWP
jgi:hypothetical protein